MGCRSIDNENPMLIDMRQVPGVSFLTQPEPALINKGQGIISLFNCSLNPIKINKGEVIAECAEGYNNHSLPAIHDSMRLLTMQSLFFAEDYYKPSYTAHSLGDNYSSIIPKTVPVIRASLSSPPPIEPLPGPPPTSLYSCLALDSDNTSNSESRANSEDSRLNSRSYKSLPSVITCRKCQLSLPQSNFTHSQLKKYATRAGCVKCVSTSSLLVSHHVTTLTHTVTPSSSNQTQVMNSTHSHVRRRSICMTGGESDIEEEKAGASIGTLL